MKLKIYEIISFIVITLNNIKFSHETDQTCDTPYRNQYINIFVDLFLGILS